MARMAKPSIERICGKNPTAENILKTGRSMIIEGQKCQELKRNFNFKK